MVLPPTLFTFEFSLVCFFYLFVSLYKQDICLTLIVDKPTFQEFPQDIVHVNASEMVTLKCVVNALPNLYVIWNIPSNFDRGNKFLNTSSVDANIAIFGSKAWTANLTIVNIQPADAGEYACDANNTMAFESRAIKLIVHCKLINFFESNGLLFL